MRTIDITFRMRINGFKFDDSLTDDEIKNYTDIIVRELLCSLDFESVKSWNGFGSENVDITFEHFEESNKWVHRHGGTKRSSANQN